MNPGNATKPEDVREQLNDDLNQIATDMLSIKSLLDEMVSNGGFNHLGASIELMAGRSGYLADRLLGTLGEVQVFGDFARWLD